MAFVIGHVARGISSGIGLGREAYLHNKGKKALREAGPSVEVTGPVEDENTYNHLHNQDINESDSEYSSLDEEDDEKDWALDEAANPPPSYEEVENENGNFVPGDTLVHQVLPEYSSQVVPTARLPYPVIIPQRRPGTKGRGFVHAYAPDLAPCGIDQETFIRFIENFYTASQGSPIFRVVSLAAGVVGMIPSITAMAVSISVQVVARTGLEVQGRYRTNAYLDNINKELFMPRGLYAMVIKYKPDDKSSLNSPQIGVETVDMMTTKVIARYAPYDEVAQKNLKAKMKTLRLASGTSKGEGAMPTICAPLIFPGLDSTRTESNQLSPQATLSPQASNSASRSGSPSNDSEPPSPGPSTTTTSQNGFRNKTQRAGKFISDYYDRRAQATYISKNPTSTLATSTAPPKFLSRYADPTHPASNGNLINLVSGGAANIPSLQDRRNSRQESRNVRRIARGRQPRVGENKGLVGLAVGGVKKVLTEDVMYLIIVNMPSESELKEARQDLGIEDV